MGGGGSAGERGGGGGEGITSMATSCDKKMKE
jgi:hypothetical protein